MPQPHLHPQSRTTKPTDSDPLVAAFRAIERNALKASGELEQAISTATGKVRQFLVAAHDVHTRCASIAEDAARAVEQAERLVSRRAR